MALIDQIIGVESGGDPNARNPRSSASGLGQFIDATWVSMLQKHRPDIANGKSPNELLALKSDPALSREMTEAYAKDNGAILSGAGLPVNPGNTYLAHFAGPQGAVSVLQADPSTPVERILEPRAIAANPFLKGMTAADLQAWASKKMGGASQPASQQPAPAGPAGPIQAIPQPSGLSFAAAPQVQQEPAQPLQFPTAELGPMQPIRPPPRRPIDLSRLRAALQQGPYGAFFNARG